MVRKIRILIEKGHCWFLSNFPLILYNLLQIKYETGEGSLILFHPQWPSHNDLNDVYRGDRTVLVLFICRYCGHPITMGTTLSYKDVCLKMLTECQYIFKTDINPISTLWALLMYTSWSIVSSWGVKLSENSSRWFLICVIAKLLSSACLSSVPNRATPMDLNKHFPSPTLFCLVKPKFWRYVSWLYISVGTLPSFSFSLEFPVLSTD